MATKNYSNIKTLAVMILTIVLLCCITFGTLAYFNLQLDASGDFTVGSNINFIYCNNSGTEITNTQTITDLSSGDKALNFNIKKTAGVNAKLRVYVNVSIVSTADNTVQNLLDENGNAIVSVTMGSVASGEWENDTTASAQAVKVNACWKYLKATDGTYYNIANNSTISICPKITISNTNPYATNSYKIIVTITAEMLQYENANW